MIDARGLACPLPVLRVQEAVKKTNSDTLEVMVDNQPAVQNVTRFATKMGYKVSVKELEDEEFSLTLTK